jgi:hypothetical protein
MYAYSHICEFVRTWYVRMYVRVILRRCMHVCTYVCMYHDHTPICIIFNGQFRTFELLFLL